MNQAQWELRNAALDFVSVSLLTRDEAALTWLLQRCVLALREMVSAETILQRVQDILPGGGWVREWGAAYVKPKTRLRRIDLFKQGRSFLESFALEQT